MLFLDIYVYKENFCNFLQVFFFCVQIILLYLNRVVNKGYRKKFEISNVIYGV